MNHTTADVALRERIAANNETLLATGQEIMHSARVAGLVLVTTCNRTEIYVEAQGINLLLEWLARRLDIDISDIQKFVYVHFDLEAARHLMQVACGLDSMVIGEVEILGQLKNAYKLAKQQGTVTKPLHRLFESAFAVAKKVRTQTEIGINPISVAYLAVRLAERIFTRIADQVVLVIGAGETAQLFIKYCVGAGVKKFIIANRTAANAQALIRNLGGNVCVEVLGLHQVPDYLAQADIVVTATNSPLPIIGKGMVELAIKARKYRAMFMIDLAVPRNIEPQVQAISDVYLYGIDDLQIIAAQHREARQIAAEEAEGIIARDVMKFSAWLDSQKSVQAIHAFRQRCEVLRDQTLAEGLQEIAAGKDPVQVMQRFAHVLLNRLIHDPTIKLRAADSDESIELLNNVKKLFDIDLKEKIIAENISERVNS